MKSYSRLIVRFALIAALVATAFYVDSLISKIGLAIKIAVVAVVVIMTLVQLFDLKTAIYSSTVFGVVSLILNYIMPNAFSYLFVNPLISVLPRIFIGLTSYSVFTAVSKAFKNGKNIFIKEYLPRSIAAAVGVLTNTILVMTMILLFDQSAFADLLSIVLVINLPAELIASVILVPIIALSVKKGIKNINI